MRYYRPAITAIVTVLLGRPVIAQDPSGNVTPPVKTSPAPSQSPAPDEQLPTEPAPTTKVVRVESVVEQTQRMTTRVAFVIDASGSMDQVERIGLAINFSRNILGQEGDELEIAIYAFNDTCFRWPGVPHDGNGPPPPPGWTQFPSLIAFNSANEWLHQQGAGGNTDPTGAIASALAEDVDDLTVVIITDGEFGAEDFKKSVADGQAGRGNRRATVVVIGVGKNAKNQKHLAEVGESEHGGFYVISEVAAGD